MARLTPENVQRAKDLIALYPQSRSALIPILHVAQEQDGWLTPDAMAHVAEERLGVANGGTTQDGMFTVEDVECIAYCGGAPCLAVNWRFFGPLTHDDFHPLGGEPRAGRAAPAGPPPRTLH